MIKATSLGNCPNCAAPIRGEECAYCGTVFKVERVIDELGELPERSPRAFKDEFGNTLWWLRDVQVHGSHCSLGQPIRMTPLFLLR